MTTKLSVSNGNIKMGAIPSISLPAIKTCREDAPCTKECYACRMEKRCKNVRNAYQNNMDLFMDNPESFKMQAIGAAFTTRYFRWHVSGDILNTEYLEMMVEVAQTCKETNFLAFTKKFELVNQYIADGGVIPENLQIIFSGWRGFKLDNPYHLPEAHVLYKDGTTTAPTNAKVCGGHCYDCICQGVGCWELKEGEAIVLREH